MVANHRQRQAICTGAVLKSGGPGIRFQVVREDSVMPAFVIRYQGKTHAYLNRCGHQGVELDWEEGNFFDVGVEFLICATHGARYAPDTGACVSGRCNGKGLIKINIDEKNGTIYFAANAGLQLVN